MDKEHIKAIRDAIIQTLPDIEPEWNSALSIKRTFVPPSHVKAIQPENGIVVGMRGAGKTFWTSALSDDSHRKHIREAYKDTKIENNTKVTVGFNASPLGDFPESDVIASLVAEQGTDSNYSALWRTILARQTDMKSSFPHSGGWAERFDWVKRNVETVANHFRNYDAGLVGET
jgi:GTPase SAR1 family protein